MEKSDIQSNLIPIISNLAFENGKLHEYLAIAYKLLREVRDCSFWK